MKKTQKIPQSEQLKKSYRKIVETEAKSIPLMYIYMTVNFTDTRIRDS